MKSVILSSKYQIVIPRNIRDELHLEPGQKIHVIANDNRIELIPERNMSEMRGFLKGVDTTIKREKDRMKILKG